MFVRRVRGVRVSIELCYFSSILLSVSLALPAPSCTAVSSARLPLPGPASPALPSPCTTYAPFFIRIRLGRFAPPTLPPLSYTSLSLSGFLQAKLQTECFCFFGTLQYLKPHNFHGTPNWSRLMGLKPHSYTHRSERTNACTPPCVVCRLPSGRRCRLLDANHQSIA